MCCIANIDLTHSEMQLVILRDVVTLADMVEKERRLLNGKIADIYFTIFNIRFIVEIKTLLKASLFENAYNKYASECDYLIIATPPDLIRDDTSTQPISWRQPYFDRIGIWHVTWDGITEARAPVCLKGKNGVLAGGLARR